MSGRATALVGLAVLFASPPLVAQVETYCLAHSECGPGGICLRGRCRGPNDTSIVKLFPVAVAPFYDLTPGTEGAEIVAKAPEILRGFLNATVFFDVVGAGNAPPGALAEGWSPTTIDWDAWQRAGAYGLVKGTLERVPGGELALDLRLYCAETGKRVPLKVDRQLVTPETLRTVLARWSDALVKEYSGRLGVFSTRIAYARRLGGQPKEIYVMGVDGTEEEPITSNGSINLLPAWTRDGSAVAYTSYKDNNPDLYVGEQKLSSRESLNMGAAWSPDGSEVALTLSKDGNAEIYVVSPKTGEILRRLTSEPSIDSSPTWSPDGERIAFVSDRGGSPQIYLMDKNGGNVTKVPQAGGYNTSPDWSPQGSLVAYNTMITATTFDIFVVDVDTGRARRLTSGPGSNEEPSWSPDGRYIVFTSTRGGAKQIWVMTADGRYPTRISTGEGDYYTPAWSPK